MTKRIAQHATCGLKHLTNPTTCCQVRWAWPVGWVLGDGKRVGWERPFGVAKGLEGKQPFSCKLFGNSQRRSQFSQSASSQRFNNFAQASRPRRWSGVPPNNVSRRRWRDASDGLRFGEWQRPWSTVPARLKLALGSV